MSCCLIWAVATSSLILTKYVFELTGIFFRGFSLCNHSTWACRHWIIVSCSAWITFNFSIILFVLRSTTWWIHVISWNSWTAWYKCQDPADASKKIIFYKMNSVLNLIYFWNLLWWSDESKIKTEESHFQSFCFLVVLLWN